MRNHRISPHQGKSYPLHSRIVAGRHAVLESLKTYPDGVSELWVSQKNVNDPIIRHALQNRIIIREVSSQTLNHFCSHHQGFVLFQNQGPSWPDVKAGKGHLFIVLDGVEDPQNLGSILRTSWLLGVDGIWVREDRAVGLTPTVHKVASGGAEHVPVCTEIRFENTLHEYKKLGFWIFGFEAKGGVNFYSIKFPFRVIFCFGAEETGLRPGTRKACDELLSIPQVASHASLNVSVSVAITLGEYSRQNSSNLELSQS